MHYIRSIKQIASIAVLSAAAACAEPNDRPTASAAPEIRWMVVPAVAQTLTVDGRFANSIADGAPGQEVISPERATELALAYTRQFGRFQPYEAQHGEAVDLEALVAEPQVVLAEPPYETLPADMTGPVRKAGGPFYHVRLRSPVATVAVIAVSAYAHDLGISSTGKLVTPPFYGNEFRTRVLSRTGARDMISAEKAVERAYRAFGRRIAEQPRLIRMGYNYSPHMASWRLRLDSPAEVREATTGRLLATDVLYVQRDGSISVAAPSQVEERIRYRPSMNAAWREVRLPAAAGLATAFSRAVPR